MQCPQIPPHAAQCLPFPPNPNSQQSTISTVTREMIEAGGDALAIQVDVRDFANVEALVEQTMQQYKNLDVLDYNSGAIWWSSVENTSMKRFQLVQRVNPEGLYACVQACLPHLYRNGEKGKGRIVVISPPHILPLPTRQGGLRDGQVGDAGVDDGSGNGL
ncbi:hypothetical protein LTR08_003854 [Meristemomyces frigidus]|nr:hypothetical protein LTR08_003854 [Meristemomyces frigidus]